MSELKIVQETTVYKDGVVISRNTNIINIDSDESNIETETKKTNKLTRKDLDKLFEDDKFWDS